jgi:hypothetical protein
MPAATRLPSGQYYYRFASSASSKAAQLGGGWWLDFEGYNTVRQFAERNGYRLREAARLMLALPYDWTKVDLLVKTLLRSPLRAYTGEGKPAGLCAGRRSRHDLGPDPAREGASDLYPGTLRHRPDRTSLRKGVRASEHHAAVEKAEFEERQKAMIAPTLTARADARVAGTLARPCPTRRADNCSSVARRATFLRDSNVNQRFCEHAHAQWRGQ